MAKTPKKDGQDGGVEIAERPSSDLQKPRRFKVWIHNDHYTSQEFVTDILQGVFHHSAERAFALMIEVRRAGVGLAGVYPKDIAETKITTVERLAAARNFPLQLTMDPE